VPRFDDVLRRPLGLVAFESYLQGDSELIAVLDGVLNLLSKADKCLERGRSEDRALATALVDRAEKRLSQGVVGHTSPTDIRQHVTGVRDLLRGHRRRLEDGRGQE